MEKRVEIIKEFVGKNKIFTATFIKKDGSTRVMNCQLGVKKHLKGGEQKFNPIENATFKNKYTYLIFVISEEIM